MWKYLALLLGLLYVLSPFDFLPDWFIGWGWLDDLVVVGLMARFFFQNLDKFKLSPRDAGPGAGTTDKEQAHTNGSSQTQSDPEVSDLSWDPYRVLELERSATDLEIRQAYRRLAKQYHPDKVDHLGKEFSELAENKFKDIQRAYQALRKV